MSAQPAEAATAQTILNAARSRLLEDGYAGLSTRRIAQEAGVPLSQVHYHFGSKGGMVLALLEAENARRLSRQATLYSQDAPLWRRYEQACDLLEDDLESGFVRVLQEMIAAGWSNPDIAAAARSILGGWYDLLTDVATEAAERFGGLGPFSPAEVATLIGNAFIGSEALLLLGFDRHRLPIRASLRRLGEVIKTAEEAAAAGGSAASTRRSGPMRARQPDDSGYAERDGVKLRWEVFGDGEPTVMLLPTWSIIHSRHWKVQVPYLARHHRVVTFDGRGCGGSDRPVGAEHYTDDQFAADTIAVLDATGTERAVLVGLSAGALWAMQVAADASRACARRGDDRRGSSARGSSLPSAPASRSRIRSTTTEGWAKYNRHYWERDFEGFLEFFFGQMFTEPHSTKQIEDCVGWGLETEPGTLADTSRGFQSCGSEGIPRRL